MLLTTESPLQPPEQKFLKLEMFYRPEGDVCGIPAPGFCFCFCFFVFFLSRCFLQLLLLTVFYFGKFNIISNASCCDGDISPYIHTSRAKESSVKVNRA